MSKRRNARTARIPKNAWLDRAKGIVEYRRKRSWQERQAMEAGTSVPAYDPDPLMRELEIVRHGGWLKPKGLAEMRSNIHKLDAWIAARPVGRGRKPDLSTLRRLWAARELAARWHGGAKAASWRGRVGPASVAWAWEMMTGHPPSPEALKKQLQRARSGLLREFDQFLDAENSVP